MRDELCWRERWLRILARISVIRSSEDESNLLTRLQGAEAPVVIGFVNAHAMNSMVGNGPFFSALAGADILLRDGSGMSMLYRSRGLEPGLNMNGTDLIPKMLAAFRGRRVAFWGTEEPYLSCAVQRCADAYGVVPVAVHHGFDEMAVYLDQVRVKQPELIVLGMGMPKQELLADAIRKAGIPAVIVCGGAIIDFLGGKVARAPTWMRRLGCEWLYRLLLEPRRLFRRYVMGNPVFLGRLALLYFR